MEASGNSSSSLTVTKQGHRAQWQRHNTNSLFSEQRLQLRPHCPLPSRLQPGPHCAAYPPQASARLPRESESLCPLKDSRKGASHEVQLGARAGQSLPSQPPGLPGTAAIVWDGGVVCDGDHFQAPHGQPLDGRQASWPQALHHHSDVGHTLP